MNNNNNLSIKLKENLDKNDYANINDLKNICTDYDNTFLKLEIDYKFSNSNSNSDNLNHINEFMFYCGNNLIGYAGICDFGGEALEVNGMVHPGFRRKGIFTRLFSFVKDEFNKRKLTDMLLLSDNNSMAGIEFIKKVGCIYDHSEYDMNLDMDVTHELNSDLIFRKAISNDINKMANGNFEFLFEDEIKTISDSASHGTYVIEKDGDIIGKVRLEITDSIGGIYGLEVIPEYRGKGHGRELLLLSIKKLKEITVNEITLQVETKNKNALNLYKSCGFKENYTMDYYRLRK